MYTTRRNFSLDGMTAFRELARKYYDVDDGAGYFLDLGANIGTTCIYFIKKFAPNLRGLAFEPDAENFKLLHTNLILNDMTEQITAVNSGLGDKFDSLTMYRNLTNPGANSVFKVYNDTPTATIKIIPLDAYLAENQIDARAVKYIWIDTEGFEAQVLLGAKNLLRENPAPIFMEGNLGAWEKSGCLEPLITLLAEGYSHFILLEAGKQILYPLEALRTLDRSKINFGRRGDFFLIRKGANV